MDRAAEGPNLSEPVGSPGVDQPARELDEDHGLEGPAAEEWIMVDGRIGSPREDI